MKYVKQSILLSLLTLPLLAPSKNVSAQAPVIKTASANKAAVSLHRDDKMDKVHRQFFNKNPDVVLLHWKKNGSELEIYLGKEKVESYDLSNVIDAKKAEKKYGYIPSPAAGSYSL